MIQCWRRRLLQLGLFAVTAALSPACSQRMANFNKANILVIGAGIAGLAAARELKSSGFNVIVLEGRDRIGGRIHTDRKLGIPLDLGAQWIHGINQNPIGKLARDFQLRIQPTDYNNTETYGANGKPIAETELNNYDMLGYVSPQEKDFSEFFNLRRYHQVPVLVALTGGSFARSLEQLSDEAVAEKAMKLLRRVHGNSIPNPDAVVKTKWASDPFSLGSYSTVPVGGKGSDRTALAAPLGNRLFFAGEATSREYPATVHGAFLSGVREAERIRKQFIS